MRYHWLPAFLCAGGLFWFGLADGVSQGGKNKKPGEINTPPAFSERKNTRLKLGDPAPDFALPDLKKTREVKLSSFQNQKPVVLIFGSYT